MSEFDTLRSQPGVCEVEEFAGARALPGASPDLLLELPHGATEAEHFHALHRQLRGPFPDELDAFFFTNTDVGAPETARRVAALIVDPPPPLRARIGEPGARTAAVSRVLLVRCLVPRTFIDCNRDVRAGAGDFREAGVTPALPDYVRDPSDAARLAALYDAYQDLSRRAYERTCAGGGLALTLHTYAPRSVGIERVGDDIVREMREAYAPGRYETWPERPEIDLITEDPDGRRMAPQMVVDALHRLYAEVGLHVEENRTYRLHPATMGHRHADHWPGQVLCMEINRALVADPFVPFQPMRIGQDKVERVALPLAQALLEGLTIRRGDVP